MQPTSTASNPLFDRDFLRATMMGPNCVRFAEELTANIPLSPHMRVLDLGCGMGLSSIYLARTFGVRVFAADLWINPSDNFARFRGDGRRRRREQYVADNAFVVGDKDGAGVPVLGGIAVAHENDVLLREDARFKFHGGRDRAERARIGFGAQGIGRAGNGAGRLHNSWRQAARSKRRVHIVEDQDAEMEAALPAALLKDRSPLAFGFVLQLHGGHPRAN